LENHFGWIGLVLVAGGVAVYALAVLLRLNSSATLPPWFASAVCSVLVLSGIQLMTSWLLVKVLAQLSQRETHARHDLGAVREEAMLASVSVAPANTPVEGLAISAQAR
jgi:hypothetical protein